MKYIYRLKYTRLIFTYTQKKEMLTDLNINEQYLSILKQSKYL